MSCGLCAVRASARAKTHIHHSTRPHQRIPRQAAEAVPLTACVLGVKSTAGGADVSVLVSVDTRTRTD
jgi:hypothetical protein